MDVVSMYDPCDSLRSALDVGYCCCGDRFCVRCVRFVVFVSVAFNKVWVVVVLTENVVFGIWFRRLGCQMSRKLVVLVLSKFVWSSLCEK